MKIGILTQPLKANYGCVLQAYALQTVLIRMGHHVEVIRRDYAKPSLKIRAKRVLRFIHTLFLKSVFNKKYLVLSNPFKIDYTYLPKSRVYDFVDSYINQGRRIHTSEALKSYCIEQGFDAYIVGSDQVWRPCYSPCITNYFLDFIPTDYPVKRIAYAASFGSADWEYTYSQSEECAKLVKCFDAIGVREKSGIKLCLDKLGVDATHVLDPTMLLDVADYDRLIGDSNVIPKMTKYIACYILDENTDKRKLIDVVSSELDAQPYYLNEKIINNKYVNLSVEEWLDAYRHADFVIVDSFHGCVFSILFKKQFIVYANRSRGIARFESLLGLFDLESRMISSLEEFRTRKADLFTTIDYNSVHAKLDELRKDSLSFLLRALSSEKNSC